MTDRSLRGALAALLALLAGAAPALAVPARSAGTSGGAVPAAQPGPNHVGPNDAGSNHVGSNHVGPTHAGLTRGSRAPAPSPRPALLADGRGGLELTGDPSRRLLLLVGAPRVAPAEGLRRVEPAAVLEVQLGPEGRRRLEGLLPGRRVLVQAFQPPAPGQASGAGYSIPVTLHPAGALLASLAGPGDLTVTEFMKDPTAVPDSRGEWIELRVEQPWRCDLEGVTIADLSGASFTLQNGGQGILRGPGHHFLVGADDDPQQNGGVPVEHRWSGFSLKNTADEILVYDSLGRLLEVVTYDDGARWPDTPGNSISLGAPWADSQANDDPGLWCHGSTTYGTGGDTGTPGQPNDTCP
jgi:hypothetical protein